jgi:hypothetical protein
MIVEEGRESLVPALAKEHVLCSSNDLPLCNYSGRNTCVRVAILILV